MVKTAVLMCSGWRWSTLNKRASLKFVAARLLRAAFWFAPIKLLTSDTLYGD